MPEDFVVGAADSLQAPVDAQDSPDATVALGESQDGAGEPLSNQEVREYMRTSHPNEAASLEREWGGDFDSNIEFARSYAQSVMTPELTAALEESGLGDHPEIVRFAAQQGRRLAEKPGDPSTVNTLPKENDMADQDTEAIQDNIDELMALQFSDPRKYASKKVQREIADRCLN